MSKTRQDDEPTVRSYAVTHPPGTVILPHSHGWDQLIYASRGVMRVHADEGAWIVPPHRAVWVPAGASHQIVMKRTVSIRTLYLRQGLAAISPRCRAINVTPLARELILHAVNQCPLRLTVPMHQRLIGVLIDQLTTLPTAPLQLPMPRDSRVVHVAEKLLDDPASTESLQRLALQAKTGARTAQRLFRDETGMTFEQWRCRLRVLEALELLANGRAVTEVATAVGYSTPSAFTAMFRREMGTTPSEYFRRAR